VQTMDNLALNELKQSLQKDLKSPQELSHKPGLPTGLEEIDQFLLWKGLPKGEISLFYGLPGHGATSLWMNTAQRALSSRQWVAWLNDSQTHCTFFPWPLFQKDSKLSQLLFVNDIKDRQQWIWCLNEIMSLSLFSLIGCDLSGQPLKNFQLAQLRKQAQRHQTALVFIQQQPRFYSAASFATILKFEASHIYVERALHRPTPHKIAPQQLSRRYNYAHPVFTSQSQRKTLHCRELPDAQSTRALSRA
jgi:hypothetical protein